MDTERDARDMHMEKDDPVLPLGSNSRRCPSVLEQMWGRQGEAEEMESHLTGRMDS
jgi:hypothetical protein